MSDNKMELIKELRARTNSSLIDCKKALEATSYDVEAAIDWLKKNGIVKAAKKAGRIAAEGAVIAVGNENRAVIVEINSETDFVAKNEKFVSLLNEVSNEIFKNNVSTLEEALKIKLNDGSTIENALLNATAVIGEKISLRRFNLIKALEQEKLGIYVHANQRVAAIVKVKGSNVEAAKNVAMHKFLLWTQNLHLFQTFLLHALNQLNHNLKNLMDSKISQFKFKKKFKAVDLISNYQNLF
nr:translation elongation factor Ts [Mycoplasmopsis cynos]